MIAQCKYCHNTTPGGDSAEVWICTECEGALAKGRLDRWRWISPVEEMPEDGEEVIFILCPTDGHIDVTVDAHIGWYAVDPDDGKGGFGCWHDDDAGIDEPIKPMWWMRLPEVPK